MEQEEDAPRDVTLTGIIFEGGLGLLALAIGWLIGFSPIQSIELRWEALPNHFQAVMHGLLATIPLLIVPVIFDRISWHPILELRQSVKETVVPLFRNETVLGLGLISIMAGIGEELLFRGLIQGGLHSRVPTDLGLVLAILTSSIIFGMVHFLTAAYGLVAALVSCYLGWLFWYTGDLLTPIVAHATYDFLVMIYYVKLTNWDDRPGQTDRDA